MALRGLKISGRSDLLLLLLDFLRVRWIGTPDEFPAIPTSSGSFRRPSTVLRISGSGDRSETGPASGN